HNREIVYDWMTTPNSDFGGRSPADIVREKGFSGLLAIKGYLRMKKGTVLFKERRGRANSGSAGK
nr:DUF2384 domain-containing protein [Nitrospiraceae bacterium]